MKPDDELTDAEIKALKPKGSRFDVRDGVVPGLLLRVGRNGSKTFVLAYKPRSSRQSKKLTLGRYPDLKLGEARTRARKVRAQVQGGADPAGDLHEARLALRMGRGRSFGQLAESFMENARTRLREASLRNYDFTLRTLQEKHPRFCGTPAGEIDRGQVRMLLDRVEERARRNSRGTTGTGSSSYVHAFIRAVHSWAMEREAVETNPAAAVKRPQRATMRIRVYTEDEVRGLLAAAAELEATHRPIGFLVGLAFYANPRPLEAARCLWEDIDMKRQLWVMPPERSKIKEERPIPLSDGALRVLEQLRTETGESDYLFPAPRGEGYYKNAGGSSARQRVRDLSGVKDFSLKPIQHTVATLMTEQLGIDGRPADLCKGHLPTKSARTYNRAFWEIDAQRKAFERWGRYLDRLAGRGRGAKVVRI